ncbi:hypothetical protein CN978_30080 [Priestia megaterium]|uniref:hypothetical protein n=1 Tax=Priestia megaterium TaxID=1404 RepID=UPI000BFC8CA5|nr:hypothetical protein [Priestia megaterium]PGN53952.1 hypothetical protein CN978_30080 [Priestia megaterium]
MSKAKLPPATDWQARDIEDWNTTSFRQFLYDRHRELYGLDYVGAVKRDCGMISGMIKQHDKATVKAFIDECFRQYKPTTQYPTLNFYFMKTYMGDRVLPKVLLAQRSERLLGDDTPIEKTEHSENIDELKGWF